MAIARFPVVVLDCPDPEALAAFYGALLDWKVGPDEPGDDGEAFWFARAEYGDALGFQKVDTYTPPQWPGQDVPQQMHIDVVVDDLDAGEAAVLELGATKHEHQPGTTFRVFLDPAGHPFCLCLS
jgi:predicted enzyme related to lactoylglutathione lyase